MEMLRVPEYWFSISAAFQQHSCLHPIPRGGDWIAVGCGPDTGILKAPGIPKCSQMTATVLERENNIARRRDEEDYFENCDDSRCKNAPASLDPLDAENPAGSSYKSSDERRWSQQGGVISGHNNWGAGRCFRAVPPHGSYSWGKEWAWRQTLLHKVQFKWQWGLKLKTTLGWVLHRTKSGWFPETSSFLGVAAFCVWQPFVWA